MPRRCSACIHPRRDAIDAALLAGESAAAVARAHGLTDDAVERHRKNHLAPQVAAAARLSTPSSVIQASVQRSRALAAGAAPSPAEAVDLAGLTATLARSLARLEEAANGAAQDQALVALAALSGQISRAVDTVAKLRGIGAQAAPEQRATFNLVIRMSEPARQVGGHPALIEVIAETPENRPA
jgi:transposase-like protein